MRDRIASVNGTKKITEAMKLVAAAKVRRAQDAVINPQDLEETYTQGFKHAIEKGGAGGIMCALAKSPLPGLSAALANP